MVDMKEPQWPFIEDGSIGGKEGLVGGGNESPNVAQNEQGHDRQRDPRESILLTSHQGRGLSIGQILS